MNRIYVPQWLSLLARWLEVGDGLWSPIRQKSVYEGEGKHDHRLDEIQQRHSVLHLRWLLHPLLGLPLEPFQVWQRPKDLGPQADEQQYANRDDWELVETVGLPIDDTWSETGYSMRPQGLVREELSPFDAAMSRLIAGSPTTGWLPLTLGPDAVQEWQPPRLSAFLERSIRGDVLPDIKQMLISEPDPTKHSSFTVSSKHDFGVPRLWGVADDDLRLAHPNLAHKTKATYAPLQLLLLCAGSDPFGSLALGFGTIFAYNSQMAYMVTVKHSFTLNYPFAAGVTFTGEFASVVLSPQLYHIETAAPIALQAARRSIDPPQVLDRPMLESIEVSWNADPTSTKSHPVSYAVARFGDAVERGKILLAPRSRDVGGWVPFVATRTLEEQQRADELTPIRFPDTISKRSTIRQPDNTVAIIPKPLPDDYTYAVAAQDLFGVWSGWQTVGYQSAFEEKQIPAIIAVRLTPEGQLSVDFSWDWTQRSPEFIGFQGAVIELPGVQFNARINFAGKDQPVYDPQKLVPLDATRSHSVNWGAEQDRDPNEPGVRSYRLTEQIALDFIQHDELTFTLSAQGQSHVYQTYIPNLGVSDWSKAVQIRVLSPRQPQLHYEPIELPQWASLPDLSGVSRAVLRWNTVDKAKYVVYEATETALLAAAGQLGPDTTQPFVPRLRQLRTLDLPHMRSAFRRVQDTLFDGNQYEVALPRGSAVLHIYAITAMSANQIESAWPTDSHFFPAIATPRLVLPTEPSIEVAQHAQANPPTAVVTIRPRGSIAVSRIELYRTTNERLIGDVDSMGPPIATLPLDGSEVSYNDVAAQSWKRVWYRAVAWSDDNPEQGYIGGRSPASSAVSVLLPPHTPPHLTDLQVDRTAQGGNEVLVYWRSDTAIQPTALGPHRVSVSASDEAGNVATKMVEQLDTISSVETPAQVPMADPNARWIYRVATPADYYYAWLPCPVQAQPFRVTVKLFDPLGRMSNLSLDVPATPVLAELQLGVLSVNAVPAVFLHPGGVIAAFWTILSPLEDTLLDQYTLGLFTTRRDHVGPSWQWSGTIASIQVIESRQDWVTLFEQQRSQFGIFRVASTQPPYQFGAWFVQLPLFDTLTVMLKDPLGQTVEKSGRVN